MRPIIVVVGARPNFMKMAPLYSELKKRKLNALLVHTGQHYDQNMSNIFFEELGMPKPDIYLGVGSETHAKQTAKIMIDFEQVCIENKPQRVIVAGDVNSTIACALVATKLNIPVDHVEAGLRSFDNRMPEEINRILEKIEKQGSNLEEFNNDYERLLKLNKHIDELFKIKIKEINSFGKKNAKK